MNKIILTIMKLNILMLLGVICYGLCVHDHATLYNGMTDIWRTSFIYTVDWGSIKDVEWKWWVL
jgi:hypothetical protein